MLNLVFASGAEAPEAPRDRQVLISDPEGVAQILSWRSGGDYWLSMPGLACFRFRPGSTVVTAYQEPGATEEEVTNAFQGSALPIVVPVLLGRQTLHASAVLSPDGRIVAFCGSTQAGKTTIAVGLSRRGCTLWADDTVAFEVGPDGLTALRLPFALNLREKSAAFFDALTEDSSGHVNGTPPEWARARLGAFCVLERLDEAQQPYAIERLSSSEAFVAVLGQSYRFVPQPDDQKRQMMRDYLEAVMELPVYRIRYRTGFDTLPEVIEQIGEVVLGGVVTQRK